MITLGIKTTTIQTDKETILSHHIEIILNSQLKKDKTTELAHLNAKDKSIN